MMLSEDQPPEPTTPDLTLIVPAHNEAAGIAATLHALQAALAPGADPAFPVIELLVACNACTDDTAAIARTAAPTACVLDLAERGKANALNQALTAAQGRNVLVVDADIAPDRRTLLALAATLDQPGVLAASPAVRFDCGGADALVRAYYRVFSRHPYLGEGVGGAGVYGLSAAGRAALGRFPAVIADDEYVRQLFPAAAQRRVAIGTDGAPVAVAVRPPRTLAILLRTEIRSRRGDAEVRRLRGPSASTPHRANPLTSLRLRWALGALLRQPLDLLVLVAIKLAVRAFLPFSRPGNAPGWVPQRD